MKRRVAALRMIMARYLFRVLLSAALIGCGAAGAQAPVASADEARAQESAAQRLGSEWSVEGLETIVRSGNTRLVEAYERGFRQTAIRKSQEAHGKVPLPAAIESIIVAHYAEPGIGASLRRIFTASWVRYQTRPLFDLMYADWRSGKIRQGSLIMRDAILSTDLAGIEPQILDALEGLDPADGADGSGIVGFLAARKYLPAIPALVERERRAKPGRAAVLTRALLELGTPDAIEAVLERLAQASASAEPEARAEASWIAQQVASVPASIRIDFAAFRKALPAVLDAGQRGALLAFIASRNEGNGLGEVTGMLADPQLHRRALEVLVASDSVDVWRDARAAVEKLKADGALDEGRYRSAAALLDGKIADPAKHFAEQRQAQRAKEFIARQQPIQRERHELEALRQTQPGRYVKDMPPLLEALAKLADEYADLPQARVGLRQEIANEYMRVGHVARFRLNRPAEGLASYEAASRNVEDMGAFAVADTWQFDLGDKAKALASYRRLLEANRAKVPSTNDIEAGAAAWQRRWLEAQIAWLERGERFAGPVTAEDIGTIGLLAVYGGDVSPTDDYFGLTELQRRARGRTQADPSAGGADRREIAEKLDSLPLSAYALMKAIAFMDLMPDAESLLAYADRRDPAGFATASFLAFVLKAHEKGADVSGRPSDGRPSVLAAAAERFFKERPVRLKTGPDPRMATPGHTWRLLLDSLRRADLETAAECLSPGQQAKFMPSWRQLTPEQLRAMADSFTSFRLTGVPMGEGLIEAFAASGNHGGLVYFRDVGGAWKIQEM